MPKRITQDFIRRLQGKKPEKVCEYRDANLKGFVVKQPVSGPLSYYAIVATGSVRRGNRRNRKWKLGDHPAVSPTEARLLAKKVIATANLDRLPIDMHLERIRLDDFLEKHYYPWAEANLKAPDRQKTVLRRFEMWHRLFLDEIDLELVDRWRGKRLVAGVRPNTVNRDVAALRGALTKAVAWKRLESPPRR